MVRAYCPQCKNEFSKNMRFCYNCGKNLNDIINNKFELYSIGMYALEIKDYISAAFWFTEASKRQYGEAQFQLGVLYENGLGVKINIKNAEYCYKKAVENGVITASRELERLLSKKNISILEDYTYEYDEASDLSFFDVDKLSSEHSIDISEGAVIQKEFSNYSKTKTHDEIFGEEKEHLRNTIDEIDEYISNSEANAILPNMSNIVNKESRLDYLLEREKYDKTKIEIAELERLKEEPYFGRMNLKCSTTDEVDDMYVGKEPIVINGRQIVYSCWSPIGNKIYDSISTEYEYNEYKYTLQFRRKFNITSGKLVDCTEDYNINADTIYKGISDPFLKNVLEQKKNVKHLTDIIKTIQGNQNELIRKPITESFIVQGCAGSGKTMILLHRLASLKYLNPSWDLERVKIISPSESFNFHINHLWRDLKIDDIKIFCLEKYYLEILKKYECQKYNDVNICPDEECRDQDLVDYVYSDDVIRKLSDIINNTGYKEKLKKQADKNYYESDVYKRYKIKEQQYNENEMMKSPERRWRTKGPIPPKKHIIAADIYDGEFDGITNNICFENKKVYKFELYLQLFYVLWQFYCGRFSLIYR